MYSNRPRLLGGFIVTSLCISLAAYCSAAQFEWRLDQPENQGASAEKLNELTESLAARNTKALLVVKNNRIICEWYAKGHGPDRKHYTASLAKAMVGGMSLLVALNDGLIVPDDPACKYVPQWKADPIKSKITIRHLATHSSGIEDAEQDDISHMKLPGWKGGFWRKDPDPFTLSQQSSDVGVVGSPQGGGDSIRQHRHAGIAVCVLCAGGEYDRRLIARQREWIRVLAPEAPLPARQLHVRNVVLLGIFDTG